MRIVDRATFLALPPNTVFRKYSPCFFEDLEIKGETWTDDYIYTDIQSLKETTSSLQWSDAILLSEKTGQDIPLDFETGSRDGCFDQDQLFQVWSREDVLGLIDRLKECL